MNIVVLGSLSPEQVMNTIFLDSGKVRKKWKMENVKKMILAERKVKYGPVYGTNLDLI